MQDRNGGVEKFDHFHKAVFVFLFGVFDQGFFSQFYLAEQAGDGLKEGTLGFNMHFFLANLVAFFAKSALLFNLIYKVAVGADSGEKRVGLAERAFVVWFVPDFGYTFLAEEFLALGFGTQNRVNCIFPANLARGVLLGGLEHPYGGFLTIQFGFPPHFGPPISLFGVVAAQRVVIFLRAGLIRAFITRIPVIIFVAGVRIIVPVHVQ